MRVSLVAMPWSRRDRPSCAMGALSAYLSANCPGIQVRCRSEFVDVSERIGAELYDELSGHREADVLCASLLYPEKRHGARSRFIEWAGQYLPGTNVPWTDDWGAVFDSTWQHLADHVQTVAAELAVEADVVGLTTCFGQLFANLALACAVKRLAPSVVIVLGGSLVSARVGPSLLTEYDFLDYVVQGEGERPFTALVQSIAEGREATAAFDAGVVSRANAAEHACGVALSEIPNMDDLPMPNFDEYAERAESCGIDWYLPLEGSRGCWWDRSQRLNRARCACYFCNFNVQWSEYREKSPQRVAAEMAALSERHKNLKIAFADNVVRHRGVERLVDCISALGREFDFFYELRASIRPMDILRLWEAGLTRAQIGVEALSSSLLRRLGKGTTVIQNLQAMRTCLELGVTTASNLIVGFPGSTAEEVAETVEVIQSYALAYDPPRIGDFRLSVGSAVERLRTEFAIERVRNADVCGNGVPADVLQRLQLPELDFDLSAPGTDWTPVRELCRAWSKLHERRSGHPLLRYRDGGSFLVVEDERFGSLLSGTFEEAEREVYLFAMECRSRGEIERHFAGRFAPERLDEILEQFLASKVMFTENGQWLSLAAAATPQLAARRIRAAQRSPAPEISDRVAQAT